MWSSFKFNKKLITSYEYLIQCFIISKWNEVYRYSSKIVMFRWRGHRFSLYQEFLFLILVNAYNFMDNRMGVIITDITPLLVTHHWSEQDFLNK